MQKTHYFRYGLILAFCISILAGVINAGSGLAQNKNADILALPDDTGRIFSYIANESEALQVAQSIDWPVVGQWSLSFGITFITFLLFGLLALWLFPAQYRNWAVQLQDAPLRSLGRGVVVFFIGIGVALLLLVLIFGIWIFLLYIKMGGLAGSVIWVGLSSFLLALGLFTISVSYYSKLVVALVLGKLFFEHVVRRLPRHDFWMLMVGLLIYLLIREIPYLGWVIGIVATLFGLGAIWLGIRKANGSTQEMQDNFQPEVLDAERVEIDASQEPLEQFSDQTGFDDTQLSSQDDASDIPMV